MSDNNVVDFPQQGKKEHSVEELKDKAQKGGAVILQMIQKNRASGLEKADNSLKSLNDIEGIASEPNVENRLRSLESGLRGLATATDAINNLSDIFGRDIVSLMMNLDNQMKAGTMYALHLQTLLDTLKTKGLVTEGELKEHWDRLQKEISEPEKSTQ